MSNYLGHESCPKCGSRDNLARYRDGSAWCFGCGYFERPENSLAMASSRFVSSNESSLGSVVLPSDLTNILPVEPLTWLYSYGITQKEIEDYGYYWSAHNSGLVSVCTDLDGNITGTIIRFFPTRSQKYDICGSKLRMSQTQLRNRSSLLPFVFCEDQVSAIKINRIAPCVPLFGTTVSLELIIWASERSKSFRLWLDADKRKDAVKQCLNLRQKGFDISPIFTDVDPKELSNNDISSILSGNGNIL